MLNFIRKRHLSLRPTLVLSVITAIVCTALAVGLPAYFSTKKSLEDIWESLGLQVAKYVTEATLRYLSHAAPATFVADHLVQLNVIDISKPLNLLDESYFILKANPSLTSIGLAKVDGSYTGTFYLPDNTTIESIISSINTHSTSSSDQTKEEHYQLNHDMKWSKTTESYTPFDPRQLPFWQDALKSPEGFWTKPFPYPLTHHLAIAYVHPQYVNNQIIGVWIIGFKMHHIQEFLQKLKGEIGANSFIITDDGIIIADSYDDDIETRTSIKINDVASKIGQEGTILKQTWAKAKTLPQMTGMFAVSDYFAYSAHFPESSSLPWNIVTIVPKDLFFGPINKQGLQAIFIGLSLSAIFAFLGALFFGHISQKLKNIAVEMDEIGKFHFTTKSFTQEVSLVKEVNMMNTAAENMKIGLSSFAKYVPLELVHSLIRSGHSAELGGTKKEMSVLFSDLANFTGLAEKIPPDKLLELLGQYLSEMSIAITHSKGEVDKFIGDSIMAMWGAPEPLEQHALYACFGALAMQKRMKELQQDWEKQNTPVLKQRIGINTGTMVVGNIGSTNRMEYTAIGDAVNLASRLEGLNKFYGTEILIGENTAHFVAGTLLIRPIDWVSVKGRIDATLIYELIGQQEIATPSILQAISSYQEALHYYKERDFLRAKQLFEKANKEFGGHDSPSILMSKKSETYMIEPPPTNWIGATIMHEK